MGAEAAPSEIDQALTVLAYYGGNSVRAGQELGISHNTLRAWRTRTHRERYLEIAEREAPRLEALAAQQARELILRAGDAEHGILDILNDRIEGAQAPIPQRSEYADEDTWRDALETWKANTATTKELGELAGTLQRLTTSKGINGTKLLELTGRPTSIVEHRDPKADGLALLRQLGVTIDSTAQDVTTTPGLPLPTESNEANTREATSHAAGPNPPAD